MTTGIRVPTNLDEFTSLLAEAAEAVSVTSRLPTWPFSRSFGRVGICQYDRVLGSSFALVIHSLVALHDDEVVTIVVLEPSASYYETQYSHFPGFRIARESLPEHYWSGLSIEPQEDPTGAIAYTANVVAIVGSSRRWAVWGERDWGLALVLAETHRETWRHVGVPFVSARVGLDDFRGPAGWATHLSEAAMSAFVKTIEQHEADG